MPEDITEQFLRRAESDPSLRAEIAERWGAFLESLATLAKAQGLAVDRDQLARRLLGGGELTDAALDQVAGGLLGSPSGTVSLARLFPTSFTVISFPSSSGTGAEGPCAYKGGEVRSGSCTP